MFRDFSASFFRVGSTILACVMPMLVMAQASPFLTGATALQTNILAWLTPIAIILVMALGAMAMANRIAQVAGTYGNAEARTLVENCSNSLILRCSASEGGGTAAFASTLIGQREVVRTSVSSTRRFGDWYGSHTRSEHVSIEPAVLGSEIEQLPDRAGFLKLASRPEWMRVQVPVPRAVTRESTGAGLGA